MMLTQPKTSSWQMYTNLKNGQ